MIAPTTKQFREWLKDEGPKMDTTQSDAAVQKVLKGNIEQKTQANRKQIESRLTQQSEELREQLEEK